MITNIFSTYLGTVLLALPLFAIHQYFLSAAVYTIRVRLKRYSGEKTFWFVKVGDQISGYLMILLGIILPLIFLVLPLTLGAKGITPLWISYVFILIVDLVWLGSMKRGYWELVKINQGWNFFPLIKFPRKIHNIFFQPAWAMWLTLITLFLVIVWGK